jgi:hypothetical protein
MGLPRTETPYHRHGDLFAQGSLALIGWRLLRTVRSKRTTSLQG